jgi:hypothetical protein
MKIQGNAFVSQICQYNPRKDVGPYTIEDKILLVEDGSEFFIPWRSRNIHKDPKSIDDVALNDV